jgi:uncharacterized membrane protein YsdA (DUF1294 family)
MREAEFMLFMTMAVLGIIGFVVMSIDIKKFLKDKK